VPHFLRAVPPVRSERSRVSGGVEECAVYGFAGLHFASLRSGRTVTARQLVSEKTSVV